MFPFRNTPHASPNTFIVLIPKKSLMKSYIAPKVNLIHFASEQMMALSSHDEAATNPGALSNEYTGGSSIWDTEDEFGK